MLGAVFDMLKVSGLRRSLTRPCLEQAYTDCLAERRDTMLRRHHVRHCLLAALMLALAACGKADQPAASAPADSEQTPSAAADPQAPFCEEVGRRVSTGDCADLSALADQAERGAAAFNAPNPMRRGDVHTLQLAISYAPEQIAEAEPHPDGSQVNATDSISPGAPSPLTPEDVVDPLQGDTVQYAPLVGRFMRVELLGNGFEVTPLTEASQEVLPDSVTTWSWRVEAREGGQRTLTLRTVVEGCTGNGQCFPLRSTSQNFDVTVQVGFMGQAQDFLGAVPTWLRLLAGVLGALAVLVAAWFGLRNALRKGAAGA
jgi:hypothetical protein